MRRFRKGHTIVEMSVTLGVVGLIITAAAGLMSAASRSMDRTGAQLDADTSATLGLQQMMLDIREAKRVQVLSATHGYVLLQIAGAFGELDAGPLVMGPLGINLMVGLGDTRERAEASLLAALR